MNDAFWALKIAALLHDPPAKALCREGHAVRAFSAIEQILGPDLFLKLFATTSAQLQNRRDFDELRKASENYRLITRADAVAAAIDRTAFPKKVDVPDREFVPNAGVAHPLSGKSVPLTSIQSRYLDESQQYSKRAAIKPQESLLAEAVEMAKRQPHLRSVYLRLWRDLPGLSPDSETYLLPADTRIVDHTLWHHLDAACAVVGSLPRPGLLVFTLGSVQSFIEEARRTQDLWMGSYLFSFLTWRGIQRLIFEVGPDAVLYPALRGQPLVDLWLRGFNYDPPNGFSMPKADNRSLGIATLPNKFVALVAAERAGELAASAADAVRRAWLEIAEAVKRTFPGGARHGDWEKIWKRQVESPDWLDIQWAFVPWPVAVNPLDENAPLGQGDEADASMSLFEEFLGRPHPDRAVVEVFKRAFPQGVNVGTFYGWFHFLTEKCLGSRKLLRHFSAADQEEGEKCSVSGARSALRLQGKGTRREVREYWREVSGELRKPGVNRWHEVKPDGSERLSATVAVKRFAQRSYFDEKLGLRGSFPSTSQVAAAPFKEDILRVLRGDEPKGGGVSDPAAGQALRSALEAFINVLDERNLPKLSEEASQSIPCLAKIRTPPATAETVKKFLRFDGELFYPSTFTRRRLEKDFGLDIDDSGAAELAASCTALHKAAAKAGIAKPPTYFAILRMDGDRMGAWLAGENLPNLENAIHRLARERFKGLAEGKEWESIMGSPRPICAALHNTISSALSSFALQCVRQVVELRRPGRVVYAGGDDLLALVPAGEALQAADELRALYSGQASIEKQGDVWQIAIKDDESNTGFLRVGDELLTTMGPTAGISAGIAVVHHLAPLDGALVAARQAEKAAKEAYGRGSVCVFALKRSGEAIRVGGSWVSQGVSLVAAVERFRRLLRDGKVSPRLAHDLAELARAFPIEVEGRAEGPPPEAWGAAIARELKRHSQADDWYGKEGTLLVETLQALSAGFIRRRTDWQGNRIKAGLPRHESVDEDLAPSRGPVELANWLLLAGFLERIGEQ